jgi:LPXTG-site transpeptidase (sortase) family protein
MTAVKSEPKAEGQEPASASPGPAQPSPAAKPGASATPPGAGAIVQGIGIAVTLLGVLVLGFVGYVYFLSGVQEARTQTTMYATLRGELARGVAPLGSPRPGTPVAILNIPAIGLHNEVVVEGTSPENLVNGPGHLRDTSLPGQTGLAVLYGRRATFGAPFARVPQLRPGDKIAVTTGQGTAVYQVKLTGDSRNQILINPAANQMMLLTADSAFVPSHYIEVDANLISKPQPNPQGRPGVSPSEIALGNDPNALTLCLAWGLALVVVSAAGTIAAARWARWPAYLVFVPIALLVIWNLYQNLAALLPNLN